MVSTLFQGEPHSRFAQLARSKIARFYDSSQALNIRILFSPIAISRNDVTVTPLWRTPTTQHFTGTFLASPCSERRLFRTQPPYSKSYDRRNSPAALQRQGLAERTLLRGKLPTLPPDVYIERRFVNMNDVRHQQHVGIGVSLLIGEPFE